MLEANQYYQKKVIKIKIAMIGTFHEEGGVKNHIKNISLNLIKNYNAEIHVFTITKQNSYYEYKGIKVHCIKEENKKKMRLFGILLINYEIIIERIKQIQPDIIHVHGAYLPYSKVALRLKKKNIAPVILTIHSSIAEEIKAKNENVLKQYYFFAKLWINLYYEKKAIKGLDNIIAVSYALKRKISKYVDKESLISVIPNGIDITLIDKKDNHLLNIKKPSLLFVGRLVKIKGCDILIEALKFVYPHYPNIKLYVIGNGDQLNSLIKLSSKYDLIENIKFLNYLPDWEKNLYMKSVDICIFPSRYEAFGIVLLEAMACKKPVIAAKIGGIPEILASGESGCLFEEGNAQDLAQKILNMLENPEKMKKMGLYGRNLVENKYQWEDITSKTWNIYKYCLHFP